MRRALRLSLPVALLVLALGVLSACGNGQHTSVSLAQLASEPKYWDGERVEVSGTLRSYSEPRHYWIEDQGTHRVAIENDDGLATLLVGQRVSVQGRFSYSPDRGRRIEVSALEPM